jgi:hypothetical protein
MSYTRYAGRVRLGAMFLALSGLLLASFPLVRPFGDRSGDAMAAAETFASTSWVVSHILGALGFILLPVGFLGLYSHLRDSPVGLRAFQGLVLSSLGVGLFLPIFGTEAFALRAIGSEALRQNNMSLLELAHSIRMGPQFGFLVLGLLFLAVGAILTGVAVWKSGNLPQWGGFFLALGLSFFFPLLPQTVRILDGLLTGVGAIWVATSILVSTRNEH